MRNAAIAFRASPELRAALERAAEADQRTLSSLLGKIAAEWCRKQGLLASSKLPKGKSNVVIEQLDR